METVTHWRKVSHRVSSRRTPKQGVVFPGCLSASWNPCENRGKNTYPKEEATGRGLPRPPALPTEPPLPSGPGGTISIAFSYSGATPGTGIGGGPTRTIHTTHGSRLTSHVPHFRQHPVDPPTPTGIGHICANPVEFFSRDIFHHEGRGGPLPTGVAGEAASEVGVLAVGARPVCGVGRGLRGDRLHRLPRASGQAVGYLRCCCFYPWPRHRSDGNANEDNGTKATQGQRWANDSTVVFRSGGKSGRRIKLGAFHGEEEAVGTGALML